MAIASHPMAAPGTAPLRAPSRPKAALRTAPITYEYSARKGGPIKADDAAVIGPALVALRDEEALTPTAVVEAARDEDSPLHAYFQWDDAVAAEAHRRAQARVLIASVRIRPVGSGITPVRAFYSIAPDEGPREYRPLREVFGDEEQLTQVMRRFRGDLQRMRLSYLAFRGVGAFAGFDSVFAAIEQALGAEA